MSGSDASAARPDGSRKTKGASQPAQTDAAMQSPGDTSPGCLVKVGGSLLDLPDLATRLRQLPQVLGRPCTLLVGGGEAANVIRRLQQVHSLGEHDAHALAIDAMDLNARVVRRVLAGQGPEVLPVRRCLAEAAEEGLTLPPTWTVTSDSIAALLARHRRVPLVLAKSIPPPATISTAVARDVVDAYFPTAAEGLEVSWLNLRTLEPVSVQLPV